MNVWKNTLLAGGLALAAFTLPVMAQASKTGTTTLNLTVASEASITAVNPTTTLTQATDTGMFGNFTGTTTFTYKIRTSKTSGTGAVTAAVAAFAAGGPVVATDLTYTSTTGGLGTAAIAQAASTTSSPVISAIGPDAHSGRTGNSASVAWTLIDDPAFETGTYTSVVTFTISNT